MLGSFSIHGIAHFGRPITLAKAGSTPSWPTWRLMQLIGDVLGQKFIQRGAIMHRPQHPAGSGESERVDPGRRALRARFGCREW